jgi:hypothetical protein
MDETLGKRKFDQLVEDLGRSGLIVSLDETMRAFYPRPTAEHRYPASITNLGDWLISQGLLTHWQYAKLCNGQWRGFFEVPGFKLLDHLEVDDAYSYWLGEQVDTGRRVALRVTPMSRSKVAGVLEYKVVQEFP